MTNNNNNKMNYLLYNIEIRLKKMKQNGGDLIFNKKQ
jgi:hypothetical protein